ncbi:nuclear transport factor 2 family protein [Amycolatopsis albispora]|nr:nuclear transport factor 2 family protein [Amycolatopsis albispora]
MDHLELVELMGRYADLADLKQFSELAGRVYTDEVTLDFESVTGMPPMAVPVGQYTEILRGAFAPFQATHHVISGHVIDVDGDTAKIHAHVRAEHWLPDQATGDGRNRWLVVGFYDNEAVRTPDGWRLTRVRLTSKYQENAHLAAAGQAG